MADPIEIHDVVDQDIPATVAIFREAFADNTNVQMGPHTCEAYLSSFCNLGAYRFVVACHGDEVVGFAIIQIDRTQTINNLWMVSCPVEIAIFFLRRPIYLAKRVLNLLKEWFCKHFFKRASSQRAGFETDLQMSFRLVWIAVAEKARGLGIGKRVLKYCAQLAQNQGKKYVDLSSNRTNTHAHRVFCSVGFKKIGYDENNDQHIFRLFL